MRHKTLVDLLEANRGVDRVVTYVEGENVERRVSFADIHARALGILYHLQSLGAQRGDKIIIFLSNNEQFLDGFWAALAGGIVPVPLAVGISDEHRLKLLRVARKLGKPYLYTDSKNLERLRTLAAEAGDAALMSDLASRCFLVESITDISRPGRLTRPDPSDLAFIQFSSGSTSEPKGVMLTHGNLIANIEGATTIGRYGEQDVTLSWMPLTHDMGLIGFYLVLFANRSHIHHHADGLVRAPAAALAADGGAQAGDDHLFPEFRLQALSQGSRRPQARRRRSILRARDLQRRRAHLGAALQRVHAVARVHRSSQERDVSRLRAGGSLPRRRISRARHRLPLDPGQPAQARDRLGRSS